jgi:F0F1-type ATP synthase epsilon subunit
MAVRQDASTGELVADDKPAAAGQQPLPAADTLHVKVWSPFHVYYDDEARSISGVNGTGPFDILPRHRNFITLLSACDLVLQTREGEIKIRISGGVMQVHRNAAMVFLEV